MKKARYIILAISGIIIAIALFLQEKRNFAISEVKWGYNRNAFVVSFLVLNENDVELSNKLVIRAYKDKFIGSATVTDLIGEKIVFATLSPSEHKIIKEKIDLTLGLSPNRIIVTAVN